MYLAIHVLSFQALVRSTLLSEVTTWIHYTLGAIAGEDSCPSKVHLQPRGLSARDPELDYSVHPTRSPTRKPML